MANYNSIKKKTDAQAAEKIAETNKIYDDQYAATEKKNQDQIDASDASYAKVYDRANVQRIVNERYAKEMAANMGLSNSGYNRTQQTQIMLSYNNAVLETDFQKAAAANTIRSQLASIKADIEAEKASSALSIKESYDKLATDTYNQELAAERSAAAARASAQQKDSQVNSSQIEAFKGMLADENDFYGVKDGNGLAAGAARPGITVYKGKAYAGYKKYVEDMLDSAYTNGIINTGTYKYLLTTEYNLY